VKKWAETVARVISFFGKSVSWLSFILVLLICIDVVLRYVFHFSVAWVTELEWHLFGLLFLFGSAYALSEEKQVRVDLFYQKFTPVERAQVNVIGTFFFLLPWSGCIIWYSCQYAYQSFLIKETSPDPGGLSAIYLIKMAIPLGFLLLFLQGLLIIYHQFYQAFKRN
jgi:TRAP-type mannitol/chloroaromatic compound transport system permease small subunit